jgi:sec-independent protein translocase protein TatA
MTTVTNGNGRLPTILCWINCADPRGFWKPLGSKTWVSNKEKIMPFTVGTTELLIVLVIVLLLFGVGRISKIGGEIGGAIRSFKSNMKDETSQTEESKS